MIHLPEMDGLTKTFSSLPTTPLTITAVLKQNTPVVNYDPVNLDSLLSRAVVDMVMGNETKGLPDSDEGYWLPLPLKAAWFSPDGFPLWFASVFMPDGESVTDVSYRHKRTISGHWSAGPVIRTSQGRWKERQMPVPVTVVESNRWVARAIGNAEWVGKLLQLIRFIGKDRSRGMGEVDHFEIDKAAFTEHDILVADGKLTRNIPAMAHKDIGLPWPCPPVLVGWTPPYWKRSLFLEGWRSGTTVDPLLSVDYFAAI